MKLKFILAAILSGVFLSLTWLGFTGLVLLIAFIPLLWVESYFIQHRTTNASIAFWWYALITFFVWNSLTTWWIWHATPIGAVFAIVVNSLLMSIVWWIAHVAKRNRGDGFGNIFLIFSWISFEYLHFNWDLSWPWLTLGNGFAKDIYLIQWYEYTGVFGGTLWILIMNLMIWTWLKKELIDNQPVHIFQKIIVTGFILVPGLLSSVIYHSYHEKEDPVQIVISQPNIDPYNDKFTQMPFQEQYRRLLSMSDSLGADNIDFFVGPETALHEVWLNNWKYSPPIRTIQNYLKEKYVHSAFVVGGMSFYEYLYTEKISKTARYNRDSSFIYDAFNSALMITTDGPAGIYHKSKLVSGVEKMPFKKYLGFLDRMIINLGGTTGTLATLHQPEVFEFKGIKVGVPICYESAFGEYSSGFIKNGAEILMVITNDGWWKNSPGYRQHLTYSQVLAIEMRRSIARAGNTGISCFINQKGEIEQQTKWWTQTAIKGKINRNTELTFYAKNGDFIARISVFMFILMGLTLLVGYIKEYKKRTALY